MIVNPYTRDIHSGLMTKVVAGTIKRANTEAVEGGNQSWYSRYGDAIANSPGVNYVKHLATETQTGRNLWNDPNSFIGRQMRKFAPAEYRSIDLPSNLPTGMSSKQYMQDYLQPAMQNRMTQSLSNFVDNKFASMSTWQQLRLMLSTAFGRMASALGFKNHPFRGVEEFQRQTARDFMAAHKFTPEEIASLSDEDLDGLIKDTGPTLQRLLTGDTAVGKRLQGSLAAETQALNVADAALMNHYLGHIEDEDQRNQMWSDHKAKFPAEVAREQQEWLSDPNNRATLAPEIYDNLVQQFQREKVEGGGLFGGLNLGQRTLGKGVTPAPTAEQNEAYVKATKALAPVNYTTEDLHAMNQERKQIEQQLQNPDLTGEQRRDLSIRYQEIDKTLPVVDPRPAPNRPIRPKAPEVTPDPTTEDYHRLQQERKRLEAIRTNPNSTIDQRRRASDREYALSRRMPSYTPSVRKPDPVPTIKDISRDTMEQKTNPVGLPDLDVAPAAI